jgi:hypothetical protein
MRRLWAAGGRGHVAQNVQNLLQFWAELSYDSQPQCSAARAFVVAEVSSRADYNHAARAATALPSIVKNAETSWMATTCWGGPFMRKLAVCILLVGELLLATGLFAQDRSKDPESDTVSCSFADGKEVTVRYNRVPFDKKDKLRDGKVWMPGGSAMILFSGADLKIGDKNVPMGAYTMYLIPGKKTWTLVVSKNEKPENAYDPQQDVAREAMDVGQLSQPNDSLTLYFGQMGAKQCNIRVYYGSTGTFAEILEQ